MTKLLGTPSHRLRRAVLLFSHLGLSSLSCARYSAANGATAPGAEKNPLLPRIDCKTAILPNGMTVAVVNRAELPVASFAWASRAAHDDGTPPNAGLAQLTARAIAQGENREDARARQRANGLTAGPTIVAANLGTSFEIVALSPAWKAALTELAGAIRSPPLDSDAIAVANRPATLSLAGNLKPDARFSDDRVRQFHALTYGPKDSILVAVGPFDLAEVIAAVGTSFGSWSEPSGAPSADILETPPAESTDDVARIVGVRSSGPSYVAITSACTGATDSDDLAFELISRLLRGFSASGGFRLMGLENPESYYLYANCEERRTAGTFTFKVISRPDEVRKNADVLLGALERLRSTRVEDGELTAAKQRFLGIWETELSTGTGIARAIAQYFEGGVQPDLFATFESRVRAVTSAEIQNVANRYLQPRQLHVVIGGDSAAIGADFARLGNITWFDAMPTRDLPGQHGEGTPKSASAP